jgi:hypothetical protein
MQKLLASILLATFTLDTAVATTATAEPAATTTTTSISKAKWTDFRPYAPQKKEYQFELGGMWEADNLYWMGLTYGHHIGKCYWSTDETCQQFLDFTGGFGSREAYTDGLFLVGPRWQYVKFPKPFSPSVKIFTGIMNIRDNERDKHVGVYGIGLGYTASLHKNLDLKFEARFGGGDQFWSQSVMSVSLKIDHWVDAFSGQIMKVGQTVVEGAGTVIKSTITAPKTFIEWFNSDSKSSGAEIKSTTEEKGEK